MKQLALAVLKYFSLLTALGLLLTLLATVATVYPKLPLLKQRDEKRYAHMVERAKSLALVDAYEIFKFLQEHTRKEILALDYRRLKRRLRSDEEFRKEHMTQIIEVRQERAKRMPAVYAARQKDVLLSLKPKSQKNRKADWDRLVPWDKNILLQEKCREYAALEIRDLGRRKRMQDAPGPQGNIAPLGQAPPAQEFCAEAAPLSHDPTSPAQALKALKNAMNYFYFAQMVEDLGYDPKTLTPAEEEVERMTADFN